MIELVEKSEADLASWYSTIWIDYRANLLAAGMSNEQADENVERNRGHLMVGARPSSGQYVLDIISDSVPVGSQWLGHQPGQGPNEWFIYYVVIDEAFRGTGLGRQTLLAAEEFAKSKSGTRLALNVLGTNAIARRLYESLGYEAMSLSLYKDLAQ